MNNKLKLLSKYDEIKNKTIKQISKPKTYILIYNKQQQLHYHVYLIFITFSHDLITWQQEIFIKKKKKKKRNQLHTNMIILTYNIINL